MMLSRMHETSRSRRIAGTTGLALLTAAGLAVTASGSGATETMPPGKADKSAGVTTDVPRTPVTPAAPAPEAPPASPIDQQAPVPEAPPVPPPVDRQAPVPEAQPQPPVVKPEGRATVRTIHVPKSGAAETMQAGLPEVRDAQCGPGDGTHTQIIESGDGDSSVMLICTDRIEKMAKDAQAAAMQSKRLGLKSALAGLRAAFASIQAQSDLSAEQRADALAGIEEGIAEVRSEMAEQN